MAFDRKQEVLINFFYDRCVLFNYYVYLHILLFMYCVMFMYQHIYCNWEQYFLFCQFTLQDNSKV